MRDGRLLYVAEGAKDDDRCGIGIHADAADLFDRVGDWGRNQLGHASQLVAMWLAGRKGDGVADANAAGTAADIGEEKEDGGEPRAPKKQRSFGERTLAAALPESHRAARLRISLALLTDN